MEKPRGHEGPDGIFSSALARAGEHFSAKDAEEKDTVEIWATRIGRGLSLVAFIGLAWYLGVQLHWW